MYSFDFIVEEKYDVRFLFDIWIVRHEGLSFDPKELEAGQVELVTKSSYKKMSHFEDAPFRTDCLTAVAYLIYKAAKVTIPITFIGDMPRELVVAGWSVHRIRAEEVCDGDLIFAKQVGVKRRIHHVAMCIGGKFIHSTPSGVKVEESALFFEKRTQPYEDVEGRCLLTHFFDKRNFLLKN